MKKIAADRNYRLTKRASEAAVINDLKMWLKAEGVDQELDVSTFAAFEKLWWAAQTDNCMSAEEAANV